MRKIVNLFFTIFGLLIFSGTYAQRINISIKEAPLELVFQNIQQQTDYHFIYTDGLLQNSRKVTLDVHDASLQQVLDLVFKDQPLNYSLEDKVIIVKRRDKKSQTGVADATTTIEFNGKFINEQNQPVPGVTILIKGQSTAVFSDDQGRVHFDKIAPDAVLLVSSIGYESREISIAGKSTLTITLKISVSTLDETVVKGYYNTTKRLNTGSVAKVSGEDISKQVITNPLLGLQGKAAGVFITSSSGLPGSNVTIRIRGQNSIAAGNDPLYIVDGVPFSGSALNISDQLNGANGKISPFNNINPADIESVEVLKDADATAIYGSRGANGVVLITTKKGKPGKTNIDASVYSGFSKMNEALHFLNTNQYLDLRNEAFKNDGVVPTASEAPDLFLWDPNAYTNWQKYISGGTAHNTDAQLSISGGNDKTRFVAGGNFHQESSIYRGNNKYRRAGYHLSVQHNSSDQRFGFDASIGFSTDLNTLIADPGISAFTLPPNYPIYNSDGTFNWLAGTNPAALLLQRSKSQTANLISNGTLRYQLAKHIQLKTMVGYTSTYLDQILIYPLASQDPSLVPYNYSTFGHNQVKSYIVEPQAIFSYTIASGMLRAIVGTTIQETTRSGSTVQGKNYSNESLMESLSSAGSINLATDYSSDYKYASLYALANYNYQDKYLINATFRRDGSSRFGPGKEYGNFGAAGAGWIFSKEKIISKNIPFLSYGKLRASYGITGNDQITDYQYLATYSSSGTYQNITTLRPSRVANPLYSWETTHKKELGLETGFFKDRVLLTVNWYYNKSGNQLVTYPLASQSGFTSYQANLPAVVINRGWEFDLTSSNIHHKNFKWTTAFNISFQKNRLDYYPNFSSSSFANTLVVGQDLTVVKGYHYIGAAAQTGVAQFNDVNKDGQITNPADFVVLGKKSPDYFGGLNNSLQYKSISLDFFFRFVKQKGSNYPIYGGDLFNVPVDVLQRWQKPGDITAVPVLSATPGVNAYDANFNLFTSDAVFKDASFVRLQSVQVSWQLPAALLKRIKNAAATLYVKGQNLFVLTKYKGFDPETQNTGLPFLTSYVIGCRLSL